MHSSSGKMFSRNLRCRIGLLFTNRPPTIKSAFQTLTVRPDQRGISPAVRARRPGSLRRDDPVIERTAPAPGCGPSLPWINRSMPLFFHVLYLLEDPGGEPVCPRYFAPTPRPVALHPSPQILNCCKQSPPSREAGVLPDPRRSGESPEGSRPESRARFTVPANSPTLRRPRHGKGVRLREAE